MLVTVERVDPFKLLLVSQSRYSALPLVNTVVTVSIKAE